MYQCISNRNFSGPKNLQALNLVSKPSNHLLRSRFLLNNFRRLPVIKEEGGNSEDDEVDLQNNLLRSVFKNHYRNRKGTQMNNSIDIKNLERILASKSITRLPPLASINHLMRKGVKEAEQVWETQFGKCLISGKNSAINLYKPRAPLTNNIKEECGGCQPLKFLPSRKSVYEQNGKNVAGDKAELSQAKSNRKLKNTQNLEKKFFQEKPQIIQLFGGSLFSKSSFNKSQQLVAENYQSTLDKYPSEINCKNVIKIPSNEQFSLEELHRRKKHHKTKRQTCETCEKLFSTDPQQYARHLLTHEAADRFTCKICKIHFLSLRKYKQHCRDFHFTLSSVIKKQCFEYKKPKFECKRCKAEFEMEENFETHKRIHCEKDLIEKYHLSSRNE